MQLPAVPGGSRASVPTAPAPADDPFMHFEGYNPAQYASDTSAIDAARFAGGGTVLRTNPAGPNAPPPQNVIDLGTGEVFNAGLIQQERRLYGDTRAAQMLADEISYARRSGLPVMASNPSVNPTPVAVVQRTTSTPAAVQVDLSRAAAASPVPLPYVAAPPAQVTPPQSYAATPPAQTTPADPMSAWCRLNPGGNYNGMTCPVTNPITAPEFPYIGGSYYSAGGSAPAADSGGSFVPAAVPFVQQVESSLTSQGLISGIPNWALLVGAAGALYFFTRKGGRNK